MEFSADTHPALLLDLILENIMRFMSMKELHNAARVSKRWSSLAKRVKTSRQQISYFLYNQSEKDCVEDQIGKLVELLMSEPCVALLFCASKLYKRPVAVTQGDTKRKSLLLTNYLKRILPPSCCLLGLTADGIIGTSFDRSKIVELEQSKAASCLLLPKLDNVDIHSFELTDNVMPDDGLGDNLHNTNGRYGGGESKEMSSDDVDTITRLPADKKVRFIMLLIGDRSFSDSELTEALVRRYGSTNTVVAGGFGYDIITDESVTRNRNSSTSGLGIAFCGDRLQVASVVLEADVNDREVIKQRLTRLNCCSPNRHRSVGFMFACMGRGQNFHEDENVESKVFSQLYPGVPLLGFFGGGEIGFDHPCDANVGGDRADAKIQLFHSYTTIFVMLTFT